VSTEKATIEPQIQKHTGQLEVRRLAIQDFSKDIVHVTLPEEPHIREELGTVMEMVHSKGDCDVVVDFSYVDILTSSSISALLRLRKLLGDCGHQLVFYSVSGPTKSIFTATGLDGVFEFADDELIALQTVHSTNRVLTKR
jgi:anti-anti-sigma factor